MISPQISSKPSRQLSEATNPPQVITSTGPIETFAEQQPDEPPYASQQRELLIFATNEEDQ